MSVLKETDKELVRKLATDWVRWDKYEESKEVVMKCLERDDTLEMEERMLPRISFGTAGLRARVSAGFSSMNPLVVIQTSQGLADYILNAMPGAAQDGIVIGYDFRNLSMTFAKHAAATFIAKGVQVYWYEELVHTPMVPFAVKHLDAAAGVMFTGCHHEKGVSGMKIYGVNGCLINFPDEQGISMQIEKNEKPLTWKTYKSHPLLKPILIDMEAKYIQSVKALMIPHFHGVRQVPKFLYTPLHGVGLHWILSVMRAIDPTFEQKLHIFEEQGKPDSNFPTIENVGGPNPAEYGCLLRAQVEAEKRSLKLILATDPDADRFVLSESRNGKWFQVSGDQMGCIMIWRLAEIEKYYYGTVSGRVIVHSAVSSELLPVMAKDLGLKVVETLPGFKWLGNETVALKKKGEKVLLAYEEAAGYMFPDLIHDTDGIAAALMYLTLFNLDRGSPWDQIEELGKKYGHYATENSCYRYPDAEMTWDGFKHVQDWYKPHPFKIADREVVAWLDLQKGFDSRTSDEKPTLPYSSDTWMISCWLKGQPGDHGVKWSTRREGNESKLMIYVECHSDSYRFAKTAALEVFQWLAGAWYHDPREEQRLVERGGKRDQHFPTV